MFDLVGADFRAHGYDLRHMIRVIVASRPFQLDSARDETATPTKKTPPATASKIENKKSDWADNQDAADNSIVEGDDWSIFPMTRLRPEQLIGSILQSTSLAHDRSKFAPLAAGQALLPRERVRQTVRRHGRQ